MGVQPISSGWRRFPRIAEPGISDRDRIAARRGKNIGKVAAARKLLALV